MLLNSVRQAPSGTAMVSEVHVGQSVRRGVGDDAINLLDVLSEHALRPGHQVIPDFGALLECSKAIHLNGRKVSEYVAPTLIWFNEAKPLGIVEPFDSACGHTAPPTLICCHFPSAGRACQVLRCTKMIAKGIEILRIVVIVADLFEG